MILAGSSGFIEVNSILKLNDRSTFDYTPVTGTSKIYSRSSLTLTELNQTPGRTGIFVSNGVTAESKNWDPDTSTYITGKDELVAKNRALLFSMLF